MLSIQNILYEETVEHIISTVFPETYNLVAKKIKKESGEIVFKISYNTEEIEIKNNKIPKPIKNGNKRVGFEFKDDEKATKIWNYLIGLVS